MRIYLFIAAIAGGVTYLITPLIRHIAIEIGAVGGGPPDEAMQASEHG